MKKKTFDLWMLNAAMLILKRNLTKDDRFMIDAGGEFITIIKILEKLNP